MLAEGDAGRGFIVERYSDEEGQGTSAVWADDLHVVECGIARDALTEPPPTG